MNMTVLPSSGYNGQSKKPSRPLTTEEKHVAERMFPNLSPKDAYKKYISGESDGR